MPLTVLTPRTAPKTAAETPRASRGRPGRTAARRVFVLAGVAIAVAGSAGCQRSLFRQNESRTQFESFDLMRGDFAPSAEPDVFGNPQPALRARLLR